MYRSYVQKYLTYLIASYEPCNRETQASPCTVIFPSSPAQTKCTVFFFFVVFFVLHWAMMTRMEQLSEKRFLTFNTYFGGKRRRGSRRNTKRCTELVEKIRLPNILVEQTKMLSRNSSTIAALVTSMRGKPSCATIIIGRAPSPRASIFWPI